jgi:NTP pyrophosphatase (non-canonical NTP hydrolase)
MVSSQNSQPEQPSKTRHVPDPWAPIFRLVGWLDRQNGRGQQEISLRLLKLVEESGEVAQAYIGTVGQNPRKGVTHTTADVADELCDVIITAMVALVSVADGNPDDILAAKLDKVAKRAAASEDGAA